MPQVKLGRRHRRLARKAGRSFETNEAPGAEEEDCLNADVQIGCSSAGQSEMSVQESCGPGRGGVAAPGASSTAYSCHGSWQERGTWYTIVSRNRSSGADRETLCVAMRLSEGSKELPGRVGRVEQQELWLARPQRFCDRAADQWTYKLANQGTSPARFPSPLPPVTSPTRLSRADSSVPGVCEDLTRAASSSDSSSAATRVSVVLSLGLTLLCALLAR